MKHLVKIFGLISVCIMYGCGGGKYSSSSNTYPDDGYYNSYPGTYYNSYPGSYYNSYPYYNDYPGYVRHHDSDDDDRDHSAPSSNPQVPQRTAPVNPAPQNRSEQPNQAPKNQGNTNPMPANPSREQAPAPSNPGNSNPAPSNPSTPPNPAPSNPGNANPSTQPNPR